MRDDLDTLPELCRCLWAEPGKRDSEAGRAKHKELDAGHCQTGREAAGCSSNGREDDCHGRRSRNWKICLKDRKA